MTYSLKQLAYSITALILLFIGVNRLLFMTSGSIEHFASACVYPFLKAQHSVSSSVQAWQERSRMRKELEVLVVSYHEEIEKLKTQLIETQALVDYAQATAEVRSFVDRYKTPTAILGQVLLKNFDPSDHFYLIDKGSKDGVEQDMVAVFKNCLVGRVSEVYPYYSKIMLVTDKQCKVAAYCSKNGVQGIHEGENSLEKSHVNFVNHLEVIYAHDLVISSGEGLIFPRGFALGTIEKFEPDGFNYVIAIKPSLDLSTLPFCYLIQKGASYCEPSPEKEKANSSSM